jgi:hypothetical protein
MSKTNKLLRKLIQRPLRFHHQDIHDELQVVVELLAKLVVTMQEIKDELKNTPND